MPIDNSRKICYTTFMKFSTLLDILIELLSKRRVTAQYLSEKYELSPRTVYRYVDILAQSVPLQIKRGRSGGIYLAEQYKLPMGFFTAEEYQKLLDALSEAYTKYADVGYLHVIHKLDTQERTNSYEQPLASNAEDLLFLENRTNLLPNLAEKIRIFQSCMQSQTMADIVYEGETQKIEPHALVFQGNGWGMYAFSYKKRAFRLFRIQAISSIVKLDENFRKRPFDFPSSTTPAKQIPVRLSISAKGLKKATDWLGIEYIQPHASGYIADVPLPDDETLPEKILSFGKEMKVIAPNTLKVAVAKLAAEIAALYE